MSPLGIAIPQQHLQLMGSECFHCSGGLFGPPGKLPSRQTFLTTPKTLGVITENLYRRRTAVAEDKQMSSERILGKFLTAHPSQPVDALAEIYRLHRNQDPHLRGDLNHCPVPHNPRSVSSSCPTPKPLNLKVMRVPRRPFLTLSWHSL